MEKGYNSLLMKHNLSTRNRRRPKGTNHVGEAALPSCGDELSLFLELHDGRIIDAGFDGYGCAISQASASIMLDLVRGQTLAQADGLVEDFLAMLNGGSVKDAATKLGEAVLLKEAAALPGRSGCVEMAWQTLRRALHAYSS